MKWLVEAIAIKLQAIASNEKLFNTKLLSNKKLLVAKGIATRSKDATFGAPGRTTNGAFLLVTRSY